MKESSGWNEIGARLAFNFIAETIKLPNNSVIISQVISVLGFDDLSQLQCLIN